MSPHLNNVCSERVRCQLCVRILRESCLPARLFFASGERHAGQALRR